MKTRWITIAIVFAIAMTVAPLWADFAAGLRAYNQGDYAGALKEWQPLAEKGNYSAQFNIGLMYQEGQGVPRDYAQAAQWFERAANQGYAKAQHNLGAMYGAGRGVKKDYVQAYKWMSLCASKGEPGCASQRDELEKKLNGSKLATAQRMASDFRAREE